MLSVERRQEKHGEGGVLEYSHMARPTKYTEEYIDKAKEYLELNQDEEDSVKLPTLRGLAIHLDINESTLYEWDKKYPEFSKSLDKIKTEQHDRLINKGLAGTYNSTIAKLILSSNHGMREKQDIDHTTAGKPLIDAGKQIGQMYGADGEDSV